MKQPVPLFHADVLAAQATTATPGVILVRHAERHELSCLPFERQHEVGVTTKGWRESLQLGCRLPRLGGVGTSPIWRAVQTAEAIKIGAGHAGVILVPELDLPRPAHRNEYAADLAYRGWDAATTDWLAGVSVPGGLPSATSVGLQMVHGLLTTLGVCGETLLAVTHDINILALATLLGPCPHSRCGYLHGLWLPRATLADLLLTHQSVV